MPGMIRPCACSTSCRACRSVPAIHAMTGRPAEERGWSQDRSSCCIRPPGCPASRRCRRPAAGPATTGPSPGRCTPSRRPARGGCHVREKPTSTEFAPGAVGSARPTSTPGDEGHEQTRRREEDLPGRGPRISRSASPCRWSTGPGLRRLRPLHVLGEERVDPRVVGRLQLELVVPRGQDDGRGQPLVGRQDGVRLALDVGLQLVHLGGRQVRPVGDPDGAVLHAVHGVLVGHRRVVDPAVQPHGLCWPPTGGFSVYVTGVSTCCRPGSRRSSPRPATAAAAVEEDGRHPAGHGERGRTVGIATTRTAADGRAPSPPSSWPRRGRPGRSGPWRAGAPGTASGSTCWSFPSWRTWTLVSRRTTRATGSFTPALLTVGEERHTSWRRAASRARRARSPWSPRATAATRWRGLVRQ